MTIRWLPHDVPNDWIPLIQFRPDCPVTLRISPFTEHWRTTYLHWSKEMGKTLPCLGVGHCPYCPSPSRIITYCPSAMWSPVEKRWLRRILPVQEGMREMLTFPLDITMFECVRRIRKNSPVRFTSSSVGEKYTPVPGFPLDRSLLKVWGTQECVDHVADPQ